jgi:drug/metabolite transporter (DMT)-like permease
MMARFPVPTVSAATLSLAQVAIAAAMLGTEGLLRQPLLDDMTVAAIVLAEHLLLAIFAIPVLIARRRVLARLSRRDWFILFVIGWGASGAAALLFTKALSAGSPTTASLLQNAQPLFVVFLAMIILKERLANLYWPCLFVSLIGAYLLSFGTISPVWILSVHELKAAGYALGAAAFWASGTVLARLVLPNLSYVTLTAARFLLALPFLWMVALSGGSAGDAFAGLASSPVRIIASALIPGLLGVLLFYRGLAGTRASYAVIAEFMYPAAAVAGNWMVLGTTITPLQALGCLMLLGTVGLLAWNPTWTPSLRTVRAAKAV